MNPPGASDLSTIGSTVNIHGPPTSTSVVSRDFFTENSDLVPRNDEECRKASHIEAEQGECEKYLASEPDHESIQSATPNTCRQCGESFKSQAGPNNHALRSKHGSYECKCGQKFTRSDVIRRHLDRYQPAIARYSCLLCPRHRGDNSFRRKSHLTKHLRGYHNLTLEQRHYYSEPCPFPDCPNHRYSSHSFATQRQFTDHMRLLHEESPFPCDVGNCSRIKGKGYFRKRDLIKHRQQQHPEAPEYVCPKDNILHGNRAFPCSLRCPGVVSIPVLTETSDLYGWVLVSE